MDEALKAPEYTLERLLQEAKSKQDTLTITQDLFMDVYESMIRDYITKLTVASIFFLMQSLGCPILASLLLLQ